MRTCRPVTVNIIISPKILHLLRQCDVCFIIQLSVYFHLIFVIYSLCTLSPSEKGQSRLLHDRKPGLHYFDIGPDFINYVMVCPVFICDLFVSFDYIMLANYIVFDVCSNLIRAFILIRAFCCRVDNGLWRIYSRTLRINL